MPQRLTEEETFKVIRESIIVYAVNIANEPDAADEMLTQLADDLGKMITDELLKACKGEPGAKRKKSGRSGWAVWREKKKVAKQDKKVAKQ